MVSCSSKTNDSALRAIVVFGKKIGDGCRTTAANPSILLLSARASEPSKAALAAPACRNEKDGQFDRSTRRFTAARADGDSTMVVGYYNIT
jgi:hypothetical protein